MNELSSEPSAAAKWKPLTAIQRRIVGVLVEKAKTTPEQYPLTLNALRNGSNQKSNRFPQMSLDEERIDEALEELREMGVVMEVQGSGRTSKFRHMMYEWLGVEKAELAVMAELLLRGAQTVGELRGRAARMEPIADLAALRPILASLEEKQLIVYLTPPGRGCVVTHNLYQTSEMERLRKEHGASSPAPSPPERTSSTHPPNAAAQLTTARPPVSEGDPLAEGLEQLRRDLRQARDEFAEFREQTEATIATLRSDLDDIARDLGG